MHHRPVGQVIFLPVGSPGALNRRYAHGFV